MMPEDPGPPDLGEDPPVPDDPVEGIELQPSSPTEPPPSEPIASGPESIDLPPPDPGLRAPVDDSSASRVAALSTTLNPRLAPQDVEAERSVLGGILLTNEALLEVSDAVKTEDFYREQHRKIFTAMQELALRNEPIDVITLGNELRKRGDLESIGGPAYLSSLDAAVPATANLGRYAKVVRDKARARRLIEVAHGIARDGYEQLGDVDDLLDSAEQKIFDVTEIRGPTQPTQQVSHYVKEVFLELEDLFERRSDITGLASGFRALDMRTTGWQRGDLIIIGGRPSMGKTGIVMNMAAFAAIELEQPVVVFSLEMSAKSLTKRLFSSDARVDGQRIRTGRLLETDWSLLARSADRLHRMPMFVNDRSNLTALQMRSECRRIQAKLGKKLGLVVVDYLQLMKGGSDRHGESREQEISDSSRGLKALAKDLDVPVIALSQLSRSLERREDKRPGLADLRESGSIEQDADVVCFVYRDEIYNPHSADKGIAEVIIGKQRNGPTGTVRVAFLKSYTRFENLAEDQSDGDMPQGSLM